MGRYRFGQIYPWADARIFADAHTAGDHAVRVNVHAILKGGKGPVALVLPKRGAVKNRAIPANNGTGPDDHPSTVWKGDSGPNDRTIVNITAGQKSGAGRNQASGEVPPDLMEEMRKSVAKADLKTWMQEVLQKN